MREFFKNGLLMRFNTDVSSNSLMVTALWKTEEVFLNAKKVWG